MSRQQSWHAHLRRIALGCILLLGVSTTAFAQFDRGTITWHDQRRAGRHRPGRNRHGDEHADAAIQHDRHRRQRLLHISQPRRPAATRLVVELSGFKKISRSNVQLDAAGAVSSTSRSRPARSPKKSPSRPRTRRCRRRSPVRKSVEAKDIEVLSFSGRNPIGVPALKAGVVGGNFNNAGFASLTNGGFSINGGRDRREHDHRRRRGRDPHAGRPARPSACRTSTPSRKSRC